MALNSAWSRRMALLCGMFCFTVVSFCLTTIQSNQHQQAHQKKMYDETIDRSVSSKSRFCNSSNGGSSGFHRLVETVEPYEKNTDILDH